MLSVPEAQALVDEWEREHGVPAAAAAAELAHLHRPGLASRVARALWGRRRIDQLHEAMTRVELLRAAERRERRLREAAEAERSEALEDEMIDFLRREERP